MENINEKDEKQKKFHLTITENETGETIVDCDTKCIIGAYEEGEGSGAIALTACNAIVLAGSISAVRKTIKQVLSDKPSVSSLIAMEELFSASKEE